MEEQLKHHPPPSVLRGVGAGATCERKFCSNGQRCCIQNYVAFLCTEVIYATLPHSFSMGFTTTRPGRVRLMRFATNIANNYLCEAGFSGGTAAK